MQRLAEFTLRGPVYAAGVAAMAMMVPFLFWVGAAVAGLVTGIAVNTLLLVAPELKPVPLHEGVYGLLANVTALVAVSLRTAPEPAERVRTYVESGTPAEASS